MGLLTRVLHILLEILFLEENSQLKSPLAKMIHQRKKSASSWVHYPSLLVRKRLLRKAEERLPRKENHLQKVEEKRLPQKENRPPKVEEKRLPQKMEEKHPHLKVRLEKSVLQDQNQPGRILMNSASKKAKKMSILLFMKDMAMTTNYSATIVI